MRKITVLGAGESGTGAALLARHLGDEVFVSDLKPISEKYRSKLESRNILFEEGTHSKDLILSSDLVIKSPGIPQTAPMVEKLRAAGVPIISEIEFGFLHKNEGSKIIALTGSNGKTTTVSMIYALLKYEGFDVGLAGNIGFSFAEMVACEPHEWYVLEVSSFQLEDCYAFRPNISLIINLSSNHLDRYHHRMSDYADAKFRIFRNQTEEDIFIYGADSADLTLQLQRMEGCIRARQLFFGRERKEESAAWMEDDNNIYIKLNNTMSEKNPSKNTRPDISMISTESQKVKGPHNAYNSMAAGITGSLLEIRKESIRNVLTEFEGIEHRLEPLGSVKQVEFYNDSKATTANAAWYALNSTTGPTIWIAGGVDKGNDYGLLLDIVKTKVKALVVFGKDKANFREAFGEHVSLFFEAETLEEAFAKAIEVSSEGNTILLSPACASFDMFENYEQRGNIFKELVKAHALVHAPAEKESEIR